MSASPLDVKVLFGGAVDSRRWRELHAAREVPDAYPYGLDRLAAHGFRVRETRPVERSRPLEIVRGRVLRAGGGLDWLGGGVDRFEGDVAVAWDERVGVPAALRHGHHHPVVTNVIWATDTVPRGPVLRAVVAGLGRARMVFVHSSGQVPVLTGTLGVRPDRVQPIEFGVDAEFFERRPEDDVDRDLVVSVGNDRDRDFGTVLRAFAEVRRTRPRSRLVVVSRRVTASAPGVEVVPHLRHDEVRRLVARAAVSLTLTAPNVHASGLTASLEAQALGRPVVATRNPGMQDYVRPDGGLLLEPPGDVDAVAATCLRLLEDPSESDVRGERGREAVERTFNTAAHAARLAEVLRRAVG